MRKVFHTSNPHNFTFSSFSCSTIGDYTFIIKLLDQNFNLLDQRSATIHVVSLTNMPDLVIKNIKFHKEWHMMKNIITYEMWNIGGAIIDVRPKALSVTTLLNGNENVCSTYGYILPNTYKQCFNIIKNEPDYFNINHSGYYTIKVMADTEHFFHQNDNLVNESNEHNNSLTKNIYIDLNHSGLTNIPDLTIENIIIDRIPNTQDNDKAKIEFDVVNLGSYTNDNFLVDISNQSTIENLYLNNYTFERLTTYSNRNRIHIEKTFDIGNQDNNQLQFGENKILIRVNPDTLITESNYDNNKVEKIINFYKIRDPYIEPIPFPDMPSPIKKITLKGILKKDPSSSTGISLINLNGKTLAYPTLEECTQNLDIYITCGDIDFADFTDKGVKINGYVKRINYLPLLEKRIAGENASTNQEITISRPGKTIRKFIKNSYNVTKKVYVENISLIETNEPIEITVEDEVALDITPYIDVKNNWAVDHIKFLKKNNIISQKNLKYNPESYITVAEASKIVAGVADIVNSQDLDNDSNWQTTVMNALKKEGIINSNDFSTNEFSRPIKRKEFVKMIIKALDINVDNIITSTFSDVKDDSYKRYIEKASKMGIVNGYGNSKFGPDNFIKRSELAKVIHNTLLKVENL